MTSTISVIIPVYNSRKGIEITVEAILNQKGINRDEFEIIVVDNNSTDGTLERVREYVANNSELVKLFQQEIQSSYAARNKGIKKAKGDILCFIDADMVPEPFFLHKIMKSFAKSDISYTGVNVVMSRRDKNLFSDYNVLISFHIKESIKNGHYTPTCCLIIHREVIEYVGKFDDRLESGGDVEFGKRVYRAGFKQDYLGKITINHPARCSFKALKRKAGRVGRGFAQLYHNYPKRFAYKSDTFKSLRLYCPNNPVVLYQVSKKRGLNFSFVYCILLSFVNIPLRFFQLFEYRNEMKRLNKYALSDENFKNSK